MISDRLRCIFIHIPKCAGSSFESVLWPGERTQADLWMGFVDAYHNAYQTDGLQHLRAIHVREAVGSQRFDSYFKFAIVRNPFDRVVSQYVYITRRPDLRRYLGMEDVATFSEYLELIATGPPHAQWEPQRRFLVDDSTDELLVDFVGRYENLAADAQEVFAKLGIEAELPHENRGARGRYRDYYAAGDRQRVEGIYGSDIEWLGYQF